MKENQRGGSSEQGGLQEANKAFEKLISTGEPVKSKGDIVQN
jgi:hypothetical protein